MTVMKLALVTFGNQSTRKGVSFHDNAVALRNAALAAGFDDAWAMSSKDYTGTGFDEEHAALLKEPRGAGYWVWKPWIIRQALDRIGDGDVLIYSDAGKLPIKVPMMRTERLARLALMQPEGFIAGMQLNAGRNDHWTKRDAFVLMDCDREEIRAPNQIQVGWSAWTRSPECYALLERWQHFQSDRRICSDDDNVMGLPNYDGFQENRHDQSIYTNLVLSMDLPYLDFNRRPARRYVVEVRKQDGVSLRKLWGGEEVLEKLEGHFAAEGAADPLAKVAAHAVRRRSTA